MRRACFNRSAMSFFVIRSISGVENRHSVIRGRHLCAAHVSIFVFDISSTALGAFRLLRPIAGAIRARVL